MQLSEHDLKQLDEEAIYARVLTANFLADLKEAHDRLRACEKIADRSEGATGRAWQGAGVHNF